MVRENESTVNPLLRELFQSGVYKRSQGRITRQATFAVLAIALLLGAWRWSEYVALGGPVTALVRWSTGQVEDSAAAGALAVDRFVIPGLVAVIGIWICFRVVNMPRFADFLIAVEAEINKVSWPSRGELIRSTVVVLITIFTLALVLFTYDFIWRVLLQGLGVTHG